MSIMDIINPWGALRRANADIEDLHEECNDYFNDYKDTCKALDAANALIAEGHFRNPETGRLGRKGVIYK